MQSHPQPEGQQGSRGTHTHQETAIIRKYKAAAAAAAAATAVAAPMDLYIEQMTWSARDGRFFLAGTRGALFAQIIA
jgi:hypothetical protein